MSAIAEDRNTIWNRGHIVALPVKAAAKIYNGTMVCVDASGYAISGANASGNLFIGVALEHADNTSGASGAITVQVRVLGVFQFAATGLAVANIGADLYLTDNQTVQLASANVRVGKLAYFVSSTVAAVLIDPVTLMSSPGENYFVLSASLEVIGATPKTIKVIELPRAFTVLRGYAELQVAPATEEAVTITITDGTSPQTFTVAAAAKHGQDEAIDQAYAANASITISAVDAGTTAAGLQVTLICQFN